MRKNFVLFFTLVLGSFLWLSACDMPSLDSLRPKPTVLVQTPTVVLHPTPTSDFQTVISPVCQKAEWDGTITQDGQGDMMAWSPKADDLAFMAQKNASWFVGDLAIVKGPNFSEVNDPYPTTSVYGDVTWSNDASLIAFVALRQADGLYTVMVTRPSGSGLKDLMLGKVAKTDDHASPKAILDWPNLALMEVELTCGSDCLQTAQVNPTTGSQTVSPDTRRAKDRLGGKIKTYVLDYDKAVYPAMISPNWSPDGKKIAYSTDSGEIWAIDVQGGTRYPIDLNRSGLETKWSMDSRYLAVRTERVVTVYSWGGCG